MHRSIRMTGITLALRSLAMLMVASLWMLGCGGKSSDQPPTPTLVAPFIEMAKQAPCADTKNRLFLIDQRLVFWDRAGNCPDYSFLHVLFEGSPNAILCKREDSLAGPQSTYSDPRYKTLFDTAIANLDQPDLGLSNAHSVQAIPF